MGKSDTRLLEAARKGDIETVSKLLERGVDVDAKDVDGVTALHEATENEHADVVKVLLQAGADANIRDRNWYALTPLYKAVENGYADITKMLLEGGADVNDRHTEHKTTALMVAAQKDIVEALLAKGADVNAKDAHGETALFQAARSGHTEAVKALLDAGADVEAKDDYHAITALFDAACNGHAEIVKALLEAGAAANAKDRGGMTALMSAAFGGYTETVKALLDAGVDVNTSMTDGDTALHCAAMTGQTETVRVLLENNADINVRNTSGETPLQMAAAADHTEVVDFLRQHENVVPGNSDLKLSLRKSEPKPRGANRMMNWISKIFHRSPSPSGAGNSNMANVIADRKKLLAKHIEIQIDKAKSHSQLVPAEFVRLCERLFAAHLDDMAEKVARSELCGDLQNHAYRDTKSGIYMVISVLPWTTEEAVCKLSEMSDEKPFGYVNMMSKVFINNWPSPDLTHFFHALLCMGGDTFQMHTAMGDYGGFPTAPRDFTILPVDLLNGEERSMTGL